MAITLVDSNTNVSSSATSVSTVFRVGSQSERFLIVAVSSRNRATPVSSVIWRPSGVTDGTSQTMTFLGRQMHSSSQIGVEFYGLLAPTPFTVSSASVLATYPSTQSSIQVTAVLLSGVNQTVPYAGYPSPATAFLGGMSTTNADTVTLTAQTPGANEMVVLAAHFVVGTTTDPTFVPVAGQQYLGHRTAGAASTYVSMGVQLKTATGTTTDVHATIASTTARACVIAAVPLNASTTIAPRWISPPVTAAPNALNFSAGFFDAISTTGFNETNTPGLAIGWMTRGLSGQLPTYTGVTATRFTGAAGGGGSPSTGVRMQESGGWGNVSAATLNVILPSTAAVDDIAIVSLYTQDDTGDPTSGGKFTLITSNSVAGGGTRASFRHCTYYRRVVAGDLTNEAARVTTFTNTTGAALISAIVMIYRGCLASGSPVDVSASSDISAPSSTTLLTAPTVTTTVDDTTLVTIFTGNAVTTSGADGAGTSIFGRRGIWRQHVAVGDAAWRTAGAVTANNRQWTAGAISEVSAVTIALKPASTLTVHARAATVLSGTAPTRSVARPATYARAVARSSSPARNYYLRPFADTSVWNMPIGSNAILGGAAGSAVVADTADTFAPEDDVICLETTNTRSMWLGDDPNAATTGHSTNPTPFGTAPFKADIYTDVANSPAGYAPNGSGGQLLSDGATIQEGQYMAAITAPVGSSGMVYGLRRGTTSLTGDGITFASAGGGAAVGGHGGSGMTGVGGTIRIWELIDDGVTISHALKCRANGRYLFGYNATTNPTGYVWPAIAADTGWDNSGNAGAWYHGTNANVRMGTLLTIPQSVDVTTLQKRDASGTIPVWAQRIARAIQDYGMYIVDESYEDGNGQNQMVLSLESGHQLQPLSPSFGMTPGAAYPGGTVAAEWANCLANVFGSLAAVTNNSVSTIGGGGTPVVSAGGAISMSVARVKIYGRELARTTAAMTMAVARQKVLVRGLAFGANGTRAVIRAMTYNRAPAATRTFALTIIRVIVPVVGTVYNRAVAVTTSGATRTVSRAHTVLRSVTRTTAAMTLTVRRSGSIYRRAIARAGSVTLLPTKAGSVYRRLPTRTGSIVMAVNYTKQSITISFYDYGSPNSPVIKTIDKALYPGFALYMEAQFASSSPTDSAQCHLYDVTASSIVAGSTLTTTTPHDTQRVYKSADISGNLTSGHTYKVRFGRGAGYTVKPIWAELSGEALL